MVNFQDLGISLKEVFPFILGDGKFSGFLNLNISKMTASFRNFETLGGNSERRDA